MEDIKVIEQDEVSATAEAADATTVAAPVSEARLTATMPQRESGYARAARLRAAGSVATSGLAYVFDRNDPEPYEKTGFAD